MYHATRVSCWFIDIISAFYFDSPINLYITYLHDEYWDNVMLSMSPELRVDQIPKNSAETMIRVQEYDTNRMRNFIFRVYF